MSLAGAQPWAHATSLPQAGPHRNTTVRREHLMYPPRDPQPGSATAHEPRHEDARKTMRTTVAQRYNVIFNIS